MTSYFAEPAFAEAFSESRQTSAAATASRIMDLADIQPGQQVIDLCCGPGLIAQHLAERVGAGGEVIGIDASAAMIELARRNVRAANSRFVQGDAYALPSLVPDPVDCVVATSAWQNFLTDKERIIGAVGRVLKPAGRFVFDIRLRERAGKEAAGAAPMMKFRQRIVTLLREEYPDLAIDETSGVGPVGARGPGWKPYTREDIDRDVALMEANEFRLAKREEVVGGPFAGGMLERQRWRVDYWLSRTAPGLSAEGRAKILDRIAAEAREHRSSRAPRQVTTVYVIMEAKALP
jgi:SAM-dependent methyltransferase